MKKMLLKYLIVTFMLLVTFFSIVIKPCAANFKYSDFNWEELLDQNKEYWVSGCDEGDEKCHDRILKTQKEFYTRLYKILAHYEDKEHITGLDDNIIIATVFYELGPDDFRDPIKGEDNPYNIDEESATSFIGSEADNELNIEEAKKYFKEERDSLKTLINNMISYKEPCYGVSDETPIEVNGKTTCSNEYFPYENKCVVIIDKLSVSYFDGLFRKMDLLGLFKSDNEKKCEELSSNYSDYELGKISQRKEVDIEGYWEFLINSNYFDKKAHLQSYFETILKKTNHRKMTELNSTEYEDNKEEIIKARTRIVEGIKTILKDYEPYKSNVSMTSGSVSSYWWPIGSVETTESNGKLMAIGDPESIDITSNYGNRSMILGEEDMHYGIDIGGNENSTNIIAAKSGTVVSIIDDEGGKCVNGDEDCGSGYGNFIIIQHTDGNFTVYAHLANGTLTVKNGDVVSQGEVIGKIGNTGKSTGPHLHFEVRVNGNDKTSSQDPLNFIDPNEPRKTGMEGEFIEWIKALEGTELQGDKFVVHDAEGTGKYRTFSYGIVVEFNSDVIEKHGLTPSSLQYGSLVDQEVGMNILYDVLEQHTNSVKQKISSAGINLEQKEIEALISLEFNAGNIGGFVNAYNKYGKSQSLCDNYWVGNSSGGFGGLPKRRKAECDLFVNGTYNMSPYG